MNPVNNERRKALVWLAGAGMAGLGGSAWAQAGERGAKQAARPPACTVTPAQTEGPYFVDNKLQRADLRTEPGGAARAGVPLDLSLRVMNVSGNACAPLAGAVVDVWHCDAQGVYSGVDDRSTRFLRGYQLTDGQGRVRFMTIYPGWYPGRAAHIHFKVRGAPAGARGFEFTSQLYFDEAVNERVFAQAPYARAGGRVRNERDGGFRASGGQLTLALSPSGPGYAGTFDIGMRTG